MMKLQNILWVAILLILPGNVWAYGEAGSSGPGTGVCAKLKFSDFKPGNNSEVAPRSAFSFVASSMAYPNSIKVTIKGQSVPLTVTPKGEGVKVTGNLPDTLKGTYAKIIIDARGFNECAVSDGWLVKVTE
jgi:hypothetical protein